jgi:hypothetical protein
MYSLMGSLVVSEYYRLRSAAKSPVQPSFRFPFRWPRTRRTGLKFFPHNCTTEIFYCAVSLAVLNLGLVAELVQSRSSMQSYKG